MLPSQQEEKKYVTLSYFDVLFWWILVVGIRSLQAGFSMKKKPVMWKSATSFLLHAGLENKLFFKDLKLLAHEEKRFLRDSSDIAG